MVVVVEKERERRRLARRALSSEEYLEGGEKTRGLLLDALQDKQLMIKKE